MDGTGDPGEIRSIAVRVEDVVRALEARERDQAAAVLRITPPFSGRMRARLHVEGGEDYDPDDRDVPIHVPPERLVEEPPQFPSPDDTEDELRSSAGGYSPDRHREYHERRVEEWRAEVADRVRDRATVRVDDDRVEVDVSLLGSWPPS